MEMVYFKKKWVFLNHFFNIDGTHNNWGPINTKHLTSQVLKWEHILFLTLHQVAYVNAMQALRQRAFPRFHPDSGFQSKIKGKSFVAVIIFEWNIVFELLNRKLFH